MTSGSSFRLIFISLQRKPRWVFNLPKAHSITIKAGEKWNPKSFRDSFLPSIGEFFHMQNLKVNKWAQQAHHLFTFEYFTTP